MWDIFNEADNGNVGNYGHERERVPAAADAKGTELRPLEKAVAARTPPPRPLTFATIRYLQSHAADAVTWWSVKPLICKGENTDSSTF